MKVPTDSPPALDWATCQAADGCAGVRVGGSGACLAHLDESELARWLAGLGPGSELDLRGTQIAAERLDAVLSALHDENGRPCLGAVRFERAHFTGDVDFDRALFTENAWFYGAQFTGAAKFERAQFAGSAGFGGTQFGGDIRLSRALFTGNAGFYRAQFAGKASFDGAQFAGNACFNEARFTREVRFDRARFTGPSEFERAHFIGEAYFQNVQFIDHAWFKDAQFTKNALFIECQFSNGAWFEKVQFGAHAWFKEARFTGLTWFREAQFSGGAGFVRTQFTEARFGRAQFAAEAWFDEAQFTGVVGFDRVRFTGDTRFYGAQFTKSAWFHESEFTGGARFDRAQFTELAWFEDARFTGPVVLGPLLVCGTLGFSAASFEDTLVVQAIAERVRMDRATCAAGVSLQLRYAEVVLDGVRLAQPMTLTAADPFTWPIASGPAPFDEAVLARPGRSPMPYLLSVRATDVADLVITDLSLAPCQFAGAHHLDQLRLEGAIDFAQPPRGLRVAWAWPPLWWWTRRQTLAEEHAWRATRPKGNGWHGDKTQPPAWLEEATGQPPRVIGPERLAGLYRALRQAQESRKNEPGAADFYYGEMEMRRLATATPWVERMILFWYWLIAGYGLRGLRALIALGVVVTTLAGLFHAIGFVPARPALSWWDSLLYTAGSSVSIPDDALKLTAWGKLLRILLRLIGPLLLGLALLSIRNRVKR